MLRSYRVFRPIDDRKYVMIDLDFDGVSEAVAFLVRLRESWARVPRKDHGEPAARIVEEAESRAY